ncbi:uncharacterized protein PG998_006180 [Apiospora kogelbergensis]|uniref:uncharacterized protein n=1 Tax=Apiospora kogelbergensis TaxID=1337665 RepID=UPI003132520E
MASPSFRRLLPRVQASIDSSEPGEPGEPVKKRKLVPLACARCRSHKTKCDGLRPSCGSCRARTAECTYDDDPNTTPTANLRRQYHHLAEQHQSFHELFEMLRSRPEDEAWVILQRLRSSGNVQSTLHHVKAGYLLADTRMVGGQGPEANDDVPFPPCPKNREEVMLGVDHSNAYPFLPPVEEIQSALGYKMRNITDANPDEDDWATADEVEDAKHLDRTRELYDDRLLQIHASDWTTVTNSDTIVRNLISLYLSWDHATMRLFDEELFLDQISTGKRDYCSPVFVNALLAAATLNYSAIDHDLCRDFGPKFFEEARELWESDSEQQPRLMLVPTATLLNMWCYSNGAEKTGLEFENESIRIGIDLGLFRTLPREPMLCDDYTRIMTRGEAMVAWGLFNWQSYAPFRISTFLFFDTVFVHSFFRRRSLELPNPPYYPALYDPENHDYSEVAWNPFPLHRPEHRLHRDLTSRAFSELWIIIWEGAINQQQNSHPDRPSSPLKHGLNDVQVRYDRYKGIQARLLNWSDRLPLELVQDSESLPSTLDLHQFFHGIMVQLFRPFANFDFPDQANAKAITQASLSQMRRIIYTQRYRYGGPPFSSTTVGSIHLFTSSLLEELAKSDDVDPHARFYLVLAAEEMKRCGNAFPFIYKVLHQLLSKARSDGTRLPPDLDDMFDDLEARLDQSGAETDDLIDATYKLQLGDDDRDQQQPVVDGVVSSRRKKGKGRRGSGGGE